MLNFSFFSSFFPQNYSFFYVLPTCAALLLLDDPFVPSAFSSFLLYPFFSFPFQNILSFVFLL